MNKYKALILDLDGTLLNTLEDLADAVNHSLAKFGEPTCDMPTIRSYVGNGNKRLIELAIASGEKHPDFKAIFKDYMDYYASHIDIKTRPYDGIEEVISYCKENGIKLAVISNKIHNAAEGLIKKFFGEDFDFILGDTFDFPKKPAPDPGFKACEALGVSVSECLYVGDSGVDGEFGDNIGMDYLLATYGFNDMSALSQYHPIAFISKPQEILLYL